MRWESASLRVSPSTFPDACLASVAILTSNLQYCNTIVHVIYHAVTPNRSGQSRDSQNFRFCRAASNVEFHFATLHLNDLQTPGLPSESIETTTKNHAQLLLSRMEAQTIRSDVETKWLKHISASATLHEDHQNAKQQNFTYRTD